MKVLHLISGGDTGGAKTHVITLLKEIQKHIDIKLVCFMKEEAFYSDVVKNDIPIEIIEQTKRYDLRVIKKIIQMIRTEKYDLIHTHGARANFIATILKRYINIPIVTTIHSDYLLDFDRPLYRKLLYTGLNIIALKFIDYYIAVSQNFKNMLVERGFLEEKVFMVYNGIDFDQEVQHVSKEHFLSSRGITLDEEDILIGIIGRLDHVKGHDVFLRAAAEVVAQVPHAKFMLAGDGEEREHLKRLAKQLRIEKNVLFLGFVSPVYDFINAIDINTLTSYSESFPYALLEGAKMKKPTISSAVGGIPDLIRDGENGYLFEVADYKELSKKLLQLIHDESLRKNFGQKLYEHAKEHFSSSSLSRSHIQIYEEILLRTRGLKKEKWGKGEKDE